jgi:imidazolonepropionase-like amidohydrolase
MCFFHGLEGPMTRADALIGIAALGTMPILPTIQPAPNPIEANAHRDYTAIVGATVLADDLEPTANATILLHGNKIEAVGPATSVVIPDSAYRIDATGMYAMPGLIDSHVHFFQSGGLYTRPDIIDLRSVRPYTDELQWIKGNLQDTFARYLRAGVTSVVDVGGPFSNYDVRALAGQTVAAPRVMAAGPLISSVERTVLDPNGDPPIVKIASVEAAKKLIDREIDKQTDYVKFWWVVLPDVPASAFAPVAKGAIDYAHSRGARVCIHALELETARLAVESGTDILVHSVFDKDVDDAFVNVLRSRKVIYCPTLIVLGNYGSTFAAAPNLTPWDLRVANPDAIGTLFNLTDVEGALPPEVVARLRARRPADLPHAAMRNLKRVHDAGITIAGGTDAGNIGTQHASSLYDEMLLMVGSGLSPKEVLRSVTQGGAAMMGRSQDLGTIAAGRLADIVILRDNPLDDVRAVTSVRYTIKDGHVFETASILKESPEQIVQRQVNALNHHDIDVFSESYANDATVMRPYVPAVRSRAAIASAYRDFLAKCPDLRVEIVDRKVKGNVVTDVEHVTGLQGGRSAEGTTTYRVAGGFITRAEVVMS